MTAIKGTNVAAPVVPFDSQDIYPTHDEQYGKGGYRTVADVTARDAIPSQRRTAGMLVFVAATSTTYQLAADLTTWNTFSAGGGSTRYDIAVYYPAKPTDGQIILALEMVTNVKLLASLTGSKFKIGILPTATTTFTFKKNGTSIGSVSFSTSGTPTVTFLADVSFVAGDELSIVNQSPADGTAANPSFTFVGTPY